MKNLPAKRGNPLAEAEDQELASFCDAIDVDEMSFEDWQETHESLEIIIPLFVTCAIAKSGGHR